MVTNNEALKIINTKSRNSYDQANCLSRIYCWFVLQFLFRYYKKHFDLDDIDSCAKDDQSNRLGHCLRRSWNAEIVVRGKSASLIRAIIKCFGCQFAFQNLKDLLVYFVKFLMPIALGRIIHYSNRYFEEKVQSNVGTTKLESDLLFKWFALTLTNRENVILYSSLLAFAILVNFCLSHPYYFCKFRYGMNVRVGLTRLVYEKALRVTNQAVQQNTTGKIVNLISNDVNRIDMAYVYCCYLYLAPIETAFGMYLLYNYIGWSCLGSLGIILVYIPFQTLMANVLSRFRSASIALTDDRLKLMSEILPAMRVIKMYVWERPFSALVHKARKLEIAKIRHSMILRSINTGLHFVASKIMSFICIIIFLVYGTGELNAEIVFVTLALVAQIRELITFFFPLAISYTVEAYISIKRIEKFLLEDEIEDNQNVQLKTELENSLTVKSAKITFDHVTVQSNSTMILKDISFEVQPVKLTIIIGPVGSGKSSILLSALKELPISSGSVDVNGKLAYVSQEAWIFSGTVRDNILFGREYNPIRYHEVVLVSALFKDFQQFAQGDQTMVDDRGTSLSGGQRARLSLARALYANADCHLLDDPLSAVDASVAKHIFKKCIKGYLKNKCVILVTHQLQFVEEADQIVVMNEGQIVALGSYRELQKRGIDVFKYSKMDELNQESASEQDSKAAEEPDELDSSFIENNPNANKTLKSIPEKSSSVLPSNPQYPNKLRIYWLYICAGAGFLLFSTFLFANVFTQVLFTGSDYWLSVWTDYVEKSMIRASNANYTFEKSSIVAVGQQENILIYSVLIGLLFAFSLIRTISYFTICMRASVNLHNRTFSSLIQAPIDFFDKTPIGEIMNRVSRDLAIIDDQLPPTAFEAIEILGNCFAVFVLCAVLNYYVVAPSLVLLISTFFVNRFYVNTARKLKRLEGSARSPLFGQLASTLNGLITIRSFGVEDKFVEQFAQAQDVHTSTYFTFIAASRLYGIFLEFICVLYVYCLMAVMNVTLDSYTGAIVGLTISQSLTLTNNLNYGIRQYTEVETCMTSVERVAEYGQLAKEELDKGKKTQIEWPSKGELSFRGVSLCYNTSVDCPVLRELSFNIRAGEKIGIVGRTGAGKSSLITALFRLTQPNGGILIDGVDTADISLAMLRSSLSIIPQEPILFSGNIRRNLDPFGKKTDTDLWDAIEKVQLKHKIVSFPAKLDSPVSECGSDFSVGQKQLICLARAILGKNKILILDEATANVDPHTDSLIQKTIRSEFSDCTVLTIAHRLNTIIDYDRVMVMDAGRLVQFDTPQHLIAQKEGIFYELYRSWNKGDE